MNRPLVHREFAFYQSSFQQLPEGREVSILSVAHDPGRFLKYSGSLMICLGIFVMSYLKGFLRGQLPWRRRRRPTASPDPHTE